MGNEGYWWLLLGALLLILIAAIGFLAVKFVSLVAREVTRARRKSG